MSNRHSALIVVLAMGISGTAWCDDDRHKKLDKGDVIVESIPLAGSDVPEVIVTAVVDAPPDRVWTVIDKCADYQRTMVHMKNTHELSRVSTPQGDIVRCESTITLPWPLSDLHGVLVAQNTVSPGRWLREWSKESGDYKLNSGSWLLTVWAPGRTLIEYRQRSDPNVPIPHWVQDLAGRYAMPDLITRIREVTK